MEKTKKQFTKDEINSHFSKSNKLKVVFTKKDGSSRTMLCTKDIETIPEEYRPKITDESDRPGKPTPDHLLSVFDLEANGWRSFIIENVLSVEPVEAIQEDLTPCSKTQV